MQAGTYIGKKVISRREFIGDFSLEEMHEGGWDVARQDSYEDEIIGETQKDFVLACLTQRQRAYAELLMQGFTRTQAAEAKAVSLQAVHQIVARMRKRLRLKGVNL